MTAAMADLVATLDLKLSADESVAPSLTCKWDTGSDTFPAAMLTITPNRDNSGVTVEMLASTGQEAIDDAWFEGVGAIPTFLVGCEDDPASTLTSCAVAVYGKKADISVGTVLSEATPEQILDAAWGITEAFAG